MPYNFYGQIYPQTFPPSDVERYNRPSDWLPLPGVLPEEERMIGLFPVFDDESNFLALYFEGNYTVDWGDGTIEDFASGEQAEHTYNFSEIDPDTLTPEGYKQVVVSVTPQSGSNLEAVNLAVVHSIRPTGGVSIPWLDITLSMPSAAPGYSILLYDSGNDNWLGSLEKLNVVTTGGTTDLQDALTYCTSLKELVIADMPSVINAADMCYRCESLKVAIFPDVQGDWDDAFYRCESLEYLEFGDISNLDSYGLGLYDNDTLKEITIGKLGTTAPYIGYYSNYVERVNILDASLLEDGYEMFYDCLSLKEVYLGPTPNLVSASDMFYNCHSLETVVFTDLSSLTEMDDAFHDCYNLKKFHCPPTPLLTDIWDAFDSCYSLQEVFFESVPSLSQLYSAFQNCYSLKSVTFENLPTGVSFIDTFQDCFSLTSIRLPAETVSLVNAFENCTALTEISISDASELFVPGLSIVTNSPGLAKLSVPGMKKSLDLTNCLLSRQAIVDIFNDLATVTETTYIDVSGNWGEPLLSPSDIQIATDKGWTVGALPPSDYPPFSCSTSVNPYRVVDFAYAWADCTALTSFPLLDVSSGTNFNGAWYGCNSLTSFPLLDVSSGTNFNFAWENCTSLTSFPAGMFDNCTATDFYNTWTNCALSEESVDNILTSLDTAGRENGYVNIDLGTSAPPGSSGMLAKTSLESKGWTVVTN